ncbi:MAG: hypothetical protein ACI85H_000947 [Paracoccaceae bacterium]|jgi:hypothetical protein
MKLGYREMIALTSAQITTLTPAEVSARPQGSV